MPAYVAWRAGYDNPVPNRVVRTGCSYSVPIAPINCLKIPAQLTGQRFSGDHIGSFLAGISRLEKKRRLF
jgi:hypothetical protein